MITNITRQSKGLRTTWLLAALATAGTLSIANALQPPTAEQIEQYRKDGSLALRVQQALQRGNHRTAQWLVWNFQRRMESARLKAMGLPEWQIDEQAVNAPPPAYQGGLPAKGNPKTIVLLVDFPSYPHSANQTSQDVANKFFGDGNSGAKPYESIRNFYQRSSYGQLTLQGNVLGWYTAQHNPDYYESLGDGPGQEALMMEAIEHFRNQGHDFSQYDNDNNGVIDALYIKWTAPVGNWASFWWAYQWGWHSNPTYRVNGKAMGSYVWSWYAYSPTTGNYDPLVDIHETGHLIGLPDLYDYLSGRGPEGGVGELDMMDGNWGDHNCFSKFLLEWLEPTTIVSGSYRLSLNPSGTSTDCVLIMPGAKPADPFAEFFMVQYRKRTTGNDPANYPTDGLLIWHIDGTLDSIGYDFKYDNSYAMHKLVRLMEADGLEQIEQNMRANSGDFYKSPLRFDPNTVPNSNSYAPAPTGVAVDSISTPGSTMTARFSVRGAATIPLDDALDCPALNWTTSGDMPWFGQTGTSHDGQDAAQSGALPDNQSAHMSAQIAGPAALSFWWKVSSEPNQDVLSVTIEGSLSDAVGISGEVDWQQKTFFVPQGLQTVRWTYTKSRYNASGSDAAWVDQVSVKADPNLYILTIEPAEGQGATTPEPGQSSLYEAQTYSILATPAKGWKLDHWLLNGVAAGNTNPLKGTMNGDLTVRAVFTPITYALTIQPSEGQGATEPNAGTLRINEGDPYSIQATPAQNWFFDHWVVNGTSGGTANPLTGAMTADLTVKAVFARITHTLTIEKPNGQGSTKPPTGTYTRNEGDSYSIQATAATDWAFDRWILNGQDAGSTNPLTGRMDADVKVQAVFIRTHYAMTIQTPDGLGTTSPATGTYKLTPAESYSVQATPANGWYLDHWTVNKQNAGAANPLTGIIDSDLTIQAVFARITYTLTIQEPNGAGTTAPGTGSTRKNQGDLYSILAAPANHWTFNHWIVNGAEAGSTNPLSGSMTTNMTVQAVFSKIIRTLTVQPPSGEGTTTPAPGAHTVNEAEQFQVQAFAAENWVFDHWVVNGTAAGSKNPYQGSTNTNATIQAVFTRITHALIIHDPEGQGSTTPGTGTHRMNQGDSYSVQATPADGWRFDHWVISNQDGGSVNPLTGQVLPGIAIHAVFKHITYVLSVRTDPSQGVKAALSPTDTEGKSEGITNFTRTYNVGTKVSLTVPSSANEKTFVRWLKDGSDAGSTQTLQVDMTAACEVVAEYATPSHTLTIQMPDGEGSSSPTPGNYVKTHGDTYSIQATPATGWRLDQWLINNHSVTPTNPLTGMLRSDLTIKPVFAQVIYTLSVVNGTGSGTYQAGKLVTMQASVPAGQRFDRWTGDTSSLADANAPSTIVTIDGNKTLTATFQPQPIQRTYALTVTVSGGHATVTPSNGTYPEDTVIDLSATIDDGYQIASWQGTDNDASTAALHTVTLNADKTITVQVSAISQDPNKANPDNPGTPQRATGLGCLGFTPLPAILFGLLVLQLFRSHRKEDL